jgi:ATP-dependent DNA helicase RecG
MAQTKEAKALLAKFDAPWQAVLLLPDEYRDYRFLTTDFRSLTFGAGQVIAGTVGGWSFGFINGKPRLSIEVLDTNSYLIKASLFGETKALQERLADGLKQIVLSGDLVCVNDRAYLNSGKQVADADIGQLKPVYKAFQKVPSKLVAKIMPQVVASQLSEAVEQLRLQYQDVPNLRKRLDLRNETLGEVLKYLHCQSNIRDDAPHFLEKVNRYRKAVEFIAAICTVKELRRMSSKTLDGLSAHVPPLVPSINPDEIVSRLPFTPTIEQSTAIHRYFSYFAAGNRLHALAFGDVGTGKTCLAITSLAYVSLCGCRAVMMLPNGTLAKQVYNEYMASYGNIAPAKLITSDTEEIISDNDLVLIGTTKLLFAALGNISVRLLVLDEIQKFSVEQKRQLSPDGMAHVLEMSATPAPRTMLHCIHNLFEITMLTHCHVQKHIKTIIIEQDAQAEMAEIEAALQYGQVLVVCPQKVNSERSELASVEEEHQKLSQRLPWATIEYMHSARSEEDNAAAIARMKAGQSHVLVASSIVEVGITLPYLLCCVIKDAERFGLQTLHQIRGRLCRVHGGYGLCLLAISRKLKPASMQRLQALVDIDNGFELADMDMKLRGVGDISAAGVRQHGPGRLFPTLTVDVSLIEELAGTI